MRVAEEPGGERLASLDQFRGYTVAGMFLVNYIGGFAAVHEIFKHTKTYCSYADTIMPQFFFAVGFALRLTLLRRIASLGPRPAYLRALRRLLSLLIIGVLVHGVGRPAGSWDELTRLGWGTILLKTFGGVTFQALVHIAVTGLWLLPVIAARGRVYLAFLLFSAALHLGLSAWFYYEWVFQNTTIDGGVLGFLSWTIPTLAGAMAYDLVTERGPRGALAPTLALGLLFMVAGYALSCAGGVVEPPFVPPSAPVGLWTMSQKSGAVSYQTFSAGFSLAVYGLFLWLADIKGWRWSLFRTLGQNALLGYILHGFVSHHVRRLAPGDSPLWWVSLSFLIFFALTWLGLRVCEKRGVYLKL